MWERDPSIPLAASRVCLITLSRCARPPFVKVAVFRLLVGKYGARLDTVTNLKSGLLHVACEAGALDVARVLLEEHG